MGAKGTCCGLLSEAEYGSRRLFGETWCGCCDAASGLSFAGNLGIIIPCGITLLDCQWVF